MPEPGRVLLLSNQTFAKSIHAQLEGLASDRPVELITEQAILAEGAAAFVERTVGRIQANGSDIVGVVGTFLLSNLLAAVIRDRTGLPGPSAAQVARAQNKYLVCQTAHQALSDVIPAFSSLGNDEGLQRLGFPLFAKPAIGTASLLAGRIDDRETWQSWLVDPSRQARLEASLVGYREALALAQGCEEPISQVASWCLQEPLEGEQFTVDGYVADGDVQLFGLTRSVFLPGTISFDRFEFPYHLSSTVEQRIQQASSGLVRALELDNATFNIEFRWDPQTGRLGLIELNPRLSLQFAYLIAQVRGVSPLGVMLDLAAGESPAGKLKQTTQHANGYSCVLRESVDHWVEAAPQANAIKRLQAKYGAIEILPLVAAGQKLSDFLQDEATFRYCWVNIAGEDEASILHKLERIKAELGYRLRPV